MIKISQKKFTINDGYEIIESEELKEIETVSSAILNQELTKEVSTQTPKIKSIEEFEKQESETNIKILEEENKEYIKTIKKLKQQNKKLKNENKELTKKTKELNKIKNTLNTTNKNLNKKEKENKNLQKENTKLKENIQIFTINTLTKENPTEEEINHLIKQFQEQLNLKHKKENDDLKFELNSYKNKTTTLEKEKDRLKNDNNYLQKQLNNKKTELRNVKNRINTTNQELFENNNLTENINEIIQNLQDINSKFQQTTKLNTNILNNFKKIKEFDKKINSANDIYCKRCGKDTINVYEDHNAGNTIVLRHLCTNCNCKWSEITDKPIKNTNKEKINETNTKIDKTFDNFLKADKNIKLNRSSHFNEEMDVNGIKFEYIQSKIEKDEILTSDVLENQKYAIYIKAPSEKYYDEIKIVLACYNNTVTFVTVIPCLNDGKKRREYYGENEYEERNKLRRKAVSKRKK